MSEEERKDNTEPNEENSTTAETGTAESVPETPVNTAESATFDSSAGEGSGGISYSYYCGQEKAGADRAENAGNDGRFTSDRPFEGPRRPQPGMQDRGYGTPDRSGYGQPSYPYAADRQAPAGGEQNGNGYAGQSAGGQYGSQYGSQYGNQYGSQYGNQYGAGQPYAAPNGERYDSRQYQPGMEYGETAGEGKPKKKKTKKFKAEKKSISIGAMTVILVSCIVATALLSFGAAMLANRMYASSHKTSGGESVIYKSVTSGENIGTTEYSVANVASAAKECVVEITTEQLVTSSFYGQYVTKGAGSGVIISRDGYIITCAHVIDGASTVTVTLSDGTSCEAEVIGQDSMTDIGVIKIEGEDFSAATVGDSDALTVGELAVVIGNPLGRLGGSVTGGYVSALDREVEINGQSYTLLQVDAAVNPGNSGGGLFNSRAELIGVVNAKSEGSDIEGIGFAIPINGAVEIAQQLIETGYVKGRPVLGISVYDCSDAEAYYRLSRSANAGLIDYITDYGVYFLSYTEGQTDSGLKFGDRIVAVDGITVSSLADVKSLLGEYKIGDTVEVTYARKNSLKSGRSEMMKTNITLIEQTGEMTASSSEPSSDSGSSGQVPGGSDGIDPFSALDPFSFFGF